MTQSTSPRTGGEILVDQLRIHGVDLAFGVPGESYLAVLDALYSAQDIRFMVCRQEGGAAMMAEAYGKLTGRPGICFVTRGPGATNASPGVHIGFQDSSPMILFIGQVGRGVTEREAFQEIDYRRMFPEMAKWVAQIDQAERIPELVARAFATATSGRPGPVVLALPEDVLTEAVTTGDAEAYKTVMPAPRAEELEALADRLDRAERPVMIVGGGGWDAETAAQMASFAAAFDLPVATSFRCRDYFDNRHPCYVGDMGLSISPELVTRIEGADLLLVVGARLGELTTRGYRLIDIPVPAQALVHVHPSAEELGKVYQPTLAIQSSSARFAAAVAKLSPRGGMERPAWRRTARLDYEAAMAIPAHPGGLQMGQVMSWLQQHLPDDAILTNGAGNYSSWPNGFYQYSHYRSQLGPTSGSMGYGLPAAVAAKALLPNRKVICFAGDGCFLMTGQEFATAVQYRLKIIVLVINNGMYGTIRMHQERSYPGRVSGTGLENPDFAALARAFGGYGETVERTEDFAAAFERAEAAEGPALLELKIDPEAITPKASLSAIRQAALEG